MREVIITLNAGSSSLKFALFDLGADKTPRLQLSGQLSRLNATPHFDAKDINGTVLMDADIATEFETDGSEAIRDQALSRLLTWLDQYLDGARIVAAAHRVVHGGETFLAPVRVTPENLGELDALIPLAPLHQPHNVNAIKAVMAKLPHVPQVACFDTQFHATQSELAKSFAIPKDVSPLPLKRYGFHGISYDYIARVLPEYLGDKTANGKVIVAHMGNGASMCAMENRKCVATTMGYSVLDGLVMGTRCGDIDPGVLLYLLQDRGMTPQELSQLLYHQSGLQGVSGISADMQILEESSDPKAAFAIDLFCYRAARTIGSLVAALGGLDAIIFTAGIGEHSAIVREKICTQSAWLGLALDKAVNAKTHSAACISTTGSRIPAWVIPTNEEWMMANYALKDIER